MKYSLEKKKKIYKEITHKKTFYPTYDFQITKRFKYTPTFLRPDVDTGRLHHKTAADATVH